jgi:hypothetical protein
MATDVGRRLRFCCRKRCLKVEELARISDFMSVYGLLLFCKQLSSGREVRLLTYIWSPQIDLINDFGRWIARRGEREGYARENTSPSVAAMRAYLMWEDGGEVRSPNRLIGSAPPCRLGQPRACERERGAARGQECSRSGRASCFSVGPAPGRRRRQG